MVHVAICDDSRIERIHLIKALQKFFDDRKEALEIKEFETGPHLIDSIENGSIFDLIFLDVLMHGLDGIETAQRIRRLNATVPIAFLTVSPDYALESYDVFACGYLLKPIDWTRFELLMNRIIADRERASRSLAVRRGGQIQRIPYEAIIYVESHANKLIINDRRAEKIETYGKLDDLEKQLDDGRFLRCHQSYLVNMDHIVAAEEDFTVSTGARVPIKVRTRKAIRDAYFMYISTERR